MSQKKRPHSITITAPTLAQQHSKDEVDINNIMKRYVKTGVIDHVAKYAPQYGEFQSTDYHESMNIVAKANEMFAELPSQLRKKFDNDPAGFLDFVDNADPQQLIDLGLTNTPMSPPGDNPEPPAPVVQPTKTQPEPAPAASDNPD